MQYIDANIVYPAACKSCCSLKNNYHRHHSFVVLFQCIHQTVRHADSVVLDALSKVLHPEHGTLVMNLHGGGMPAVSALVALFTSRLPFASQGAPSGYHESTEKGRAVQQITQNLRLADMQST